jgi:hypothetical protein
LPRKSSIPAWQSVTSLSWKPSSPSWVCVRAYAKRLLASAALSSADSDPNISADNLDSLKRALERLEHERDKAESAADKAKKVRNDAIKRIVTMPDIELMVEKAKQLKSELDTVHEVMSYIKQHLVANNSEEEARLRFELLPVVFASMGADSNPAVAAWARWWEQLMTNSDAPMPT